MSDLTRTEVIKLIAIATQPLNLSGVDLSDADLNDTCLIKANLIGVKLTSTIVSTDSEGKKVIKEVYNPTFCKAIVS
jgi:hypothetical protein